MNDFVAFLLLKHDVMILLGCCIGFFHENTDETNLPMKLSREQVYSIISSSMIGKVA